MLKINNISTYYGKIRALEDISLSVKEGEIVSLIGSNGAGKSTLLLSIMGNPQPREGTVVFLGKEVQKKPTIEIVKNGISLVPEGRHIFPQLTVLENLQTGGIVNNMKTFSEDIQKVYDLFPILFDRKSQRAGTLSGGEQQMLAIGRALIMRPKLLLLDEPSLGLAPIIVQKIFQTIKTINSESKMTILLVEQNAVQALKASHRGYIIANGNIILSDESSKLLKNPKVQEAYLEGMVV